MSGPFHQVLEMQGQSASDGQPPCSAVLALLPVGAELLRRMHAWQAHGRCHPCPAPSIGSACTVYQLGTPWQGVKQGRLVNSAGARVGNESGGNLRRPAAGAAQAACLRTQAHQLAAALHFKRDCRHVQHPAVCSGAAPRPARAAAALRAARTSSQTRACDRQHQASIV